MIGHPTLKALTLIAGLLLPGWAAAGCPAAGEPKGALRPATQAEVDRAFRGQSIAAITQTDETSIVVSSAGSSSFGEDGIFWQGRDLTGPYPDGRWSASNGRLTLSEGYGWSIYIDEAQQVFWTQDGGWQTPWAVPFMCPAS